MHSLLHPVATYNFAHLPEGSQMVPGPGQGPWRLHHVRWVGESSGPKNWKAKIFFRVCFGDFLLEANDFLQSKKKIVMFIHKNPTESECYYPACDLTQWNPSCGRGPMVGPLPVVGDTKTWCPSTENQKSSENPQLPSFSFQKSFQKKVMTFLGGIHSWCSKFSFGFSAEGKKKLRGQFVKCKLTNLKTSENHPFSKLRNIPKKTFIGKSSHSPFYGKKICIFKAAKKEYINTVEDARK